MIKEFFMNIIKYSLGMIIIFVLSSPTILLANYIHDMRIYIFCLSIYWVLMASIISTIFDRIL